MKNFLTKREKPSNPMKGAEENAIIQAMNPKNLNQKKKKKKDWIRKQLANTGCSINTSNSTRFGQKNTLTLDSMFSFNRKLVTENLTKQLEFYFGDANLMRDAFLRQQIGKDKKGYIKIEVFLNFNKIKAILKKGRISTLQDQILALIQAVQASKLLSLSKKLDKVKRRVPFDFGILSDKDYQKGVDDRMVYVENLPSFVDRSMVEKIFSQYGKILHISVPKNSTKNNSIKGFAFIQYSRKSEVEKALQANNSIPGVFTSYVDKHRNHQEPLRTLKVITKAEWLGWKAKLKQLKKSLLYTIGDGFDANPSQRKAQLHSNSLLKFKIFQKPNLSKVDIKIALMHKTDSVAYIDYVQNSHEGYIRFFNENCKNEFLDDFGEDGRILEVKSLKLHLVELGSEEEAAYFEKVEKKRQKLKLKNLGVRAKKSLK